MEPQDMLLAKITCPNCGMQMSADKSVCAACGYKFPQPGKRTAEKIVAISLLLFVGIPAAICGGCTLLLGWDTPFGWVQGVFALAVLVVLVWLASNVFKNKP